MKNPYKKLFFGLLSLIALLVALCFTPVATAVIETLQRTPATWVSGTGTNYFRLNVNATPQVQQGTNVYTGLTTNKVVIATGITNQLQFRNGILVNVSGAQ